MITSLCIARELHEHALACFLGLDKRCKGRTPHRDSRLVAVAGSPRGDKSRLAAKPWPVPALVAYRKRVFAGAGVPDFQITQRRINGTEMEGHVRQKMLACKRVG
jgi:hypothetical protein